MQYLNWKNALFVIMILIAQACWAWRSTVPLSMCAAKGGTKQRQRRETYASLPHSESRRNRAIRRNGGVTIEEYDIKIAMAQWKRRVTKNASNKKKQPLKSSFPLELATSMTFLKTDHAVDDSNLRKFAGFAIKEATQSWKEKLAANKAILKRDAEILRKARLAAQQPMPTSPMALYQLHRPHEAITPAKLAPEPKSPLRIAPSTFIPKKSTETFWTPHTLIFRSEK